MSADILDRIQRVRVGKEGKGGLGTRTLHATFGPVGGAAIGSLIHGVGGAELGFMIGAALQNISEQTLVRIMTRADGVNALRLVQNAKTPTALQSALKALTRVAAETGASQQRLASRQQVERMKADAAQLQAKYPTSAPDSLMIAAPDHR